jgi:hypothetical protein
MATHTSHGGPSARLARLWGRRATMRVGGTPRPIVEEKQKALSGSWANELAYQVEQVRPIRQKRFLEKD